MLMRFIDLFWLTAPNFYQGPNGEGLKDFGVRDGIFYFVCAVAIGGMWLFFFFFRLGQRALLPVNDPNFVEMLEAKHG